MQVSGWEGIPLRRFSELNPVRVGVVGVVTVALVLAALLNGGMLLTALSGGSYSAAFREAGLLQSGMEVRVSGKKVGTVTGVVLEDAHVRVDFTVDDVELGDKTRAAIKAENALGRMFLDLTPAGEVELEDQIPLERTHPPFVLSEAVSGLTNTTAGIDTEQLTKSFNTLSETFTGTPEELGPALIGVQRFSQSISTRDQALRDLLRKANSLTGVLRDRNKQVVQLMTDGNALFQMIEDRQQAINDLLVNVRTATDTLTGLAKENKKTLAPALGELRGTLKILNGQLDNLRKVVGLLGGYGRQLGESLGGGPWFYGYFANLPPTNLAPMLPRLFGVGKPPNYGQAPPAPRPPGGDEGKPTGDPYDPEPGQEESPK